MLFPVLFKRLVVCFFSLRLGLFYGRYLYAYIVGDFFYLNCPGRGRFDSLSSIFPRPLPVTLRLANGGLVQMAVTPSAPSCLVWRCLVGEGCLGLLVVCGFITLLSCGPYPLETNGISPRRFVRSRF